MRLSQRQLHRYSGLIGALFLVLFSTTGILLRHLQSTPDIHIPFQEQRIQATCYLTTPSGPIGFIATDSGLFRIEKHRTDTLRRLSLPYPIHTVVGLDTDAHNRIYLGLEEGIMFLSDDLGETWERLSLPDIYPLTGFSLHGEGSQLTVTSQTGLYTSDNLGQDWQTQLTTTPAPSLYDKIKLLHTGYFWQPIIPVLYDGVMVLFLVLVLTGLAIVIRPKKRN